MSEDRAKGGLDIYEVMERAKIREKGYEAISLSVSRDKQALHDYCYDYVSRDLHSAANLQRHLKNVLDSLSMNIMKEAVKRSQPPSPEG